MRASRAVCAPNKKGKWNKGDVRKEEISIWGLKKAKRLREEFVGIMQSTGGDKKGRGSLLGFSFMHLLVHLLVLCFFMSF